MSNTLYPLLSYLKTCTWVDEGTYTALSQLESQEDVEQALLASGIFSSGDLIRLHSLLSGMQHAQQEYQLSEDHITQIPYELSRRYRVVCVGEDTKGSLLATDRLYVPAEVYQAMETPVAGVLRIKTHNLENLIEAYKAYLERDSEARIMEQAQRVRTLADFGVSLLPADHRREVAEDISSLKLIRMLVSFAVRQQASRVVLQPTTDKLEVYYVQNEVRHPLVTLSKDLATALYLKLRYQGDASLDEARSREVLLVRGLYESDREQMAQVTCIPHSKGITISIANTLYDTQGLALEEAGIRGGELSQLQHYLHQNKGLFLISGISQTGKTYAYYHILRALSDARATVSIEDSIEYEVEGVDQVWYSRRADKDFRNHIDSYTACAFRPLYDSLLYPAFHHSKRKIILGEARNGITAVIERLLASGTPQSELAHEAIINIVSYRFDRITPKHKNYSLSRGDITTLEEYISFKEFTHLCADYAIEQTHAQEWADYTWKTNTPKTGRLWTLKNRLHRVLPESNYEYARAVVEVHKVVARIPEGSRFAVLFERDMKETQKKALLRPALMHALMGDIDLKDVLAMLRA